MFQNIKPGLNNKIEKVVLPRDSAKRYGSGHIEVYATPAMIALMEQTSLGCVNFLLPEGYTTVGTEVKVQHIKATQIGKPVKCTARLIEVDRKKLVFEVHASDDQGEIGHGTHTRFIVEQEAFMSKLQNQ